jgi:hypothetical protein
MLWVHTTKEPNMMVVAWIVLIAAIVTAGILLGRKLGDF